MESGMISETYVGSEIEIVYKLIRNGIKWDRNFDVVYNVLFI